MNRVLKLFLLLAAVPALVSAGMQTEDFARAGSVWRHKIKEKAYDTILEGLDRLSLPAGFSLHVEECECTGFGGYSKLFVVTDAGTQEDDIWNYILVEDSKQGAWQAFLLYKARHVLPLWWHANYDLRTYFYAEGDEAYIPCLIDEDTQKIRYIVKSRALAPAVTESDGKYLVSCCYWSDFCGLIREVVEVFVSPEHKASLSDMEQKTLYEYDCGVMF